MQFVNRFLTFILSPIRLFSGLFRRIIPGVRKLPTLSPAFLSALILFIFLLTIEIVFLVVAYFGDRNDQTSEYASFGTYLPHLWVSIPAMFIAPILLYYFVKLLLTGETSPFPDIDESWEAGLDALAENGIDIQETPFFLVLGVRDDLFPTQLMESSRRAWPVKNARGNRQTLQWYASEEEIYLFARRAGSLSLLAYKEKTKGGRGPVSEDGGFSSTIRPEEIGGNEGDATGDFFDDSFSSADLGTGVDYEFDTGIAAGTADGESVGTGTLDARTLESGGTEEQTWPATPAAVRNEKTPLGFSNDELFEAEERLEYLCKLINKSRYPVCPINGVVTTLGMEGVENYPDQTANHSKADLACLSRTLRLRCGVTTLITDFDIEPGSVEFCERLGAKFKDRRFGKGFRVWNEPTSSQLRGVASHACGSFDQWIHKLFSAPVSLQPSEKLANRRLYRLLCRIHLKLQPALHRILPNGFGFNVDAGEDDRDCLQFGGCYFAGNGPEESRQFFVQGFFDRVTDGQGELEWNDHAYESEARIGMFANLAMLVGVVSLIALGLLIANEYGWLTFWRS